MVTAFTSQNKITKKDHEGKKEGVVDGVVGCGKEMRGDEKKRGEVGREGGH